jgi:hypothetical protein
MNCNEALSQKSRKHKHAIKKITQERAGKYVSINDDDDDDDDNDERDEDNEYDNFDSKK